MTIKDLFRVIIKLFGAYMIISCFFNLLQFISFSFSFNADYTWWQIVLILLCFVAFLGFLSIFVFLPDKVINLLKFDKGFDTAGDKALGKLNIQHLVSFVVILIGGNLLVSNFSTLLVSFGYYFQSLADRNGLGGIPQSLSNEHLYIDIVEFAVGYLLLANYHKIAVYLTRNKSLEE